MTTDHDPAGEGAASLADLIDARRHGSWLQTLIEGMPQMIWRAAGHGNWTWSSPQWTRYTGQTVAESSGTGWLDPLHAEDRAVARDAWEAAPALGEFRADLRIRHRDGRYRWFHTRGQPVRDAAGATLEWIGTATDVHDLRQLQSQQQVLVAELQHRTRNLIAVVHSISAQTLLRASTLDDFRDRFENRLAALGRVQGLLSMSEQTPITIGRLVEMELNALAEYHLQDRVKTGGPATIVRNSTAQTLALVVHELATNALKYGALASSDGRLVVHWHELVRDEDPWLHLEWRETGLAQREGPPSTRGYGRILIEQALPRQLGAETRLDLGGGQMTCTIALPLRHSHDGDHHA